MKDKRIKKALWTQAYQIALDNGMRNFGQDLSSDNGHKSHEAFQEVRRQASNLANAAVMDFEKFFESKF